jgi:mannose-1-phosphate guanylyltransferase/mannose-6-phosphate isomerase
MSHAQMDGNFVRPNKEAFLACRSESIDYAVMEHFDKVAVVPFKGAWSDVGSWNAVAALSPADDVGNRINGQGLAVHSTNTYINAPHRPVVALGTSDLVIVDTPDAVLVASADKVEQVKEVVAQLKKDGASQAVMHRRVARPWGWYDSIDMGERFQVKRIAVKPGASLSLQMHHHRAEHWIVVKGTAKVTNGEKVFLLEENQSTYIPIGVKHRLENPGKTDLEMIEVQSGGYLGEDDIVRFEDTYGRG